jgi:hypothetical protein
MTMRTFGGGGTLIDLRLDTLSPRVVVRPKIPLSVFIQN